MEPRRTHLTSPGTRVVWSEKQRNSGGAQARVFRTGQVTRFTAKFVQVAPDDGEPHASAKAPGVRNERVSQGQILGVAPPLGHRVWQMSIRLTYRAPSEVEDQARCLVGPLAVVSASREQAMKSALSIARRMYPGANSWAPVGVKPMSWDDYFRGGLGG